MVLVNGIGSGMSNQSESEGATVGSNSGEWCDAVQLDKEGEEG